nr:hypothetical protein [Tanacetum cinerariifolium]
VRGFLWGRWRELVGSRGLWWSGKKMEESGVAGVAGNQGVQYIFKCGEETG